METRVRPINDQQDYEAALALADSELERVNRQARFQSAISRVRKRAQEAGLDQFSEEELAEEIRQSRAERAR